MISQLKVLIWTPKNNISIWGFNQVIFLLHLKLAIIVFNIVVDNNNFVHTQNFLI